MKDITDTPRPGKPPDAAQRAELAASLDALGRQPGLYPSTIVSIDSGRLFHTVGTGASLTLPSGVASGDTLFAPNLNPAFFYSWDVHEQQEPDWFRVSVRFTPADFGISAATSYEIEWVVLPFFLDLGAELTVEASPNPGPNPGTTTLGDFSAKTLRMSAGPIEPNETLSADLIRGSRNGGWIWLRTDISFVPPTKHQ